MFVSAVREQLPDDHQIEERPGEDHRGLDDVYRTIVTAGWHEEAVLQLPGEIHRDSDERKAVASLAEALDDDEYVGDRPEEIAYDREIEQRRVVQQVEREIASGDFDCRSVAPGQVEMPCAAL